MGIKRRSQKLNLIINFSFNNQKLQISNQKWPATVLHANVLPANVLLALALNASVLQPKHLLVSAPSVPAKDSILISLNRLHLKRESAPFFGLSI